MREMCTLVVIVFGSVIYSAVLPCGNLPGQCSYDGYAVVMSMRARGATDASYRCDPRGGTPRR
jgi:hypothetical protein